MQTTVPEIKCSEKFLKITSNMTSSNTNECWDSNEAYLNKIFWCMS